MTRVAAEDGLEASPVSRRAPVVRVDGLTKRFPERRSWAEILRRPWARPRVTVLSEVSFQVGSGEFFGLLGPNGAGKTTLFKILATLVTPDGGTAHVLGHDVEEEADAVRRILAPVVSDERSLYWRLSALENLELFGALHRLPEEEVHTRARRLLETVGLGNVGENKIVGEFSSGMKQRLLLARALLSEPRVLLLDEPTRSLDPLAARDLRRFLREELAERRGCAVLLATHDSEEAFDLCDRVGVLDRGRLLEVGDAREMTRRYGGNRFRVVAREVSEDQRAWLDRQGVVRDWTRLPDRGDTWERYEVTLAGGLDDAGAVVSRLTMSGATVARFERVQVPLAELMDRIVTSSRENASSAGGGGAREVEAAGGAGSSRAPGSSCRSGS